MVFRFLDKLGMTKGARNDKRLLFRSTFAGGLPGLALRLLDGLAHLLLAGSLVDAYRDIVK